MKAPTTMRAARVAHHGGPKALEVTEVSTPSVPAGEVLVRVGSTALNNTDLWTREGAYGRPDDPAALSGWRGPIDFPRIQGADVAGRVVAVGSHADEGLIGRRVVIDPAIYDSDGPDANPVGLMGSERDGGYAQYVTAPRARVHDMSASPLSDDQLAALPTAYGTALGMIERGRLRRGETVLVSGASGGVGLALIQLARARGARVLAISSGSKLGPVRQAGADEVIDRAQDLVAQIRTAAPEGIDVALDVVAGDLLREALPLLREGGRWVVAGALGGYEVDFDVRRLYLHNAQVIGSSMHTPRHFEMLMDMARGAEIEPVISAVFPLDRVGEAQEELARREHVGKIVLHPWAHGSAAPAGGPRTEHNDEH
ncbi:NADPH:quinone reductase [Promicromonospora umidemergens]|uniref:Alcohol dehydrogenase family protein n=1 Tax=Promicromonospora umidemergens TaxID=629679 RepID=A0ABP8XKI4_9MICO|nr:zinc-binding dehydrogenase [Promicromonospora umidemergens]MCP2285654.1 NADPH:quinone reductase [Promicromonospora umidemergens]